MSVALPLKLVLSDEFRLAAFVVEGGFVVACNRAARELIGDAMSVGALLVDAFDLGSREKMEAAMATPGGRVCELQILRRGEIEAVTFIVVPEATRSVWIAASVGAGYTDEMQARLFELDARIADETRALARRASELNLAKRQLEEIASMRDFFMQMMSHDVKSPLATIGLVSSTIEKLARERNEEDIVGHVQVIRRNAARVLDLVTSLLDAARLEAGVVDITRERVHLARVASDVAEAVAPLAQAAGVEVVVRRSADSDVVPGDASRLQQVVTNLVDNGIRHSPRGSRLELEVLGAASRDRVRLRVRDHGPGVRPEDRARLFDRYAQGAPKTRRGTAGLGLYIARQLVELHGGHISIEDAAPGAAFVVDLPCVT
ncbi:MAG: sensor histidine kinase [Polyangiales bacterium]